MPPRKDWQANIHPTPEELAAQVERVRGYVGECQAIVDELFPESEEDRKPQEARPAPYRMFPWGGFIPPQRPPEI